MLPTIGIHGDTIDAMAQSTLVPFGYSALRAENKEGQRPLQVDLWYPADPVAEELRFTYEPGSVGKAATQAEPARDAAPLVVLSADAHGSARSYTWLAEFLARRGFIVAGVSPGEESPDRQGPTQGRLAAGRAWEQARDCSAALDFVLSHPEFGGQADPARIGAVGHSSGGAAVLALAGAVFDPAAMQAYCRSAASQNDLACQEPATSTEVGGAGGSLLDPRVRAVAALDPSLGPGHNARSLSCVQVPVHIVATVEGDFLPFEHHAGRYARLIPGAFLTPLTHGEGHFVFLDECRGEERVAGVPVCRDRDGVQRSAVHARLAEILARFFTDQLQ